MAVFNECVFSVNVGNDPSVKQINGVNGPLTVADFNAGLTILTGKGKENRTVWIKCKTFGKTAELASLNVRKGTGLVVYGQLDEEAWTDKNGVEQRKIAVVVNKFFVTNKLIRPEQQGYNQAPQYQQAGYNQPPTQQGYQQPQQPQQGYQQPQQPQQPQRGYNQPQTGYPPQQSYQQPQNYSQAPVDDI